MNWLDSKVSVYNNVYSTEGSDTTIGNFLRIGLKRKTDIDRYRETKDKGIKLSLPCATVSGIFNGRRSVSTLSSHSGLLAVDIDKKDNPRWSASELKKILSKIPQVGYVGRSVGGEGVWCIILLAYPERHKEQFNAIQRDFHAHGIEIDAACKDVSRLRVSSYDEESFIRRIPEPYTGLYTEKRPTYHISQENPTESKLWAIAICDAVKRSKADIVSGYTNWRNMGFALARGLGEDGREFFHMISSVNGSQYNPNGCDRQYNACLRSYDKEGGITFRSFVHRAEEMLPCEEWEEVKRQLHKMIGETAFSDIDVSPASESSDGVVQSASVEETSESSDNVVQSESVEVASESYDGIVQPTSVEVKYDELNEPLRDSHEYIEWLFGFGKYAAITSRPRYFNGSNLE